MEFLRQIVLGEAIAPFRLLNTITAVIPLAGSKVLDAAAASDAGHRYLAAWLRDAETKWAEYSNKGTNGEPRMTLMARIDHMRNLSGQTGQPTIRVLYTKAGTRLRAYPGRACRQAMMPKAKWSRAR